MLLVGTLGVVSLPVGSVSAQERPDTPWLGVYTQSLNEDLREAMDFNGDGVLINRVVPDSPADRAGIEKGDILVSVNSRTVSSPRALSDVVRAAKVGQQIQMVVMREGNRRSLRATLRGRPADTEDGDTWVWRDRDGDDEGEERTWEAPVPPVPPVPAVPRTPRAPRAPRIEFREGSEPLVIRTGRGRLGVRVEDLNGDLGQYFGVPDGKGALIVEVMKETPAERAGLKSGDVITRLGDRTISDASDLIEAVGEADGKVSLRVVRKGDARTVETELESSPRALRLKAGRDWMGFNQPDHVRILRDLRRGDRSGRLEIRDGVQDDLRDELRELREQLKDLREDLERMDEK
jgi:membrane-associated protease RseP (regulator of RpoE activity)